MNLFLVLGSGVVGLVVFAVVCLVSAQRWGKLRGPAHAFAALRTLGNQEADVLVKCQDDLAHLFAPSFSGNRSFLRKLGTRFLYPGLYETVLATTRVMDNTFCELINQNHFKGDPTKRIEQVVVLSADHGTRLIRFSQLLKDRGVMLFEADLFQQQQHKLKILRAAQKELQKALYTNDSIRYVETSIADLEDFAQLLGSSFQAKKPTLWVLDLILPFFSEVSVDSLLTTIHSISGDNCCVLLNTVPAMPEFTESMSTEAYTYTEQAILVLRGLFPNSLGNFELDMSQVGKWCRARGYELMKNLGPQAQQVHLIRLDGTMVGQVPDCLRVLVLGAI